METGINAFILQKFCIGEKDIRTYSPLTLAYIGDGVYDLVIRSLVVGQGNTHANLLHRKTSGMVKAKAQAELIEALLPELTEEEEAVYRRGRNAHSPTMAKNATMSDYRRATGFEALMGYLYLKNEFPRLVELVKLGLKRTGKWEIGHAQRAAEEGGHAWSAPGGAEEAGHAWSAQHAAEEAGHAWSAPGAAEEAGRASKRGEESCDTKNLP